MEDYKAIVPEMRDPGTMKHIKECGSTITLTRTSHTDQTEVERLDGYENIDSLRL